MHRPLPREQKKSGQKTCQLNKTKWTIAERSQNHAWGKSAGPVFGMSH